MTTGVLLQEIRHVHGQGSFDDYVLALADDTEARLHDIRSCTSQDISNDVLYAILDMKTKNRIFDPEILEEFRQSGQSWAAVLSAFADAVLEAVSRAQSVPERMPMEPQTIMVAMDGSRLSYLALDVGAQLRRQGRLVVLHIPQGTVAGQELAEVNTCL